MSTTTSNMRWIGANKMKRTPLLELPDEIIQTILAYLGPTDNARVSQTCRHLHLQSYDDQLWQPIVHDQLAGAEISSSGPAKSFRELYISHHPYWYLTRRRIWFADSDPHGKLLMSRYNEQTGSIEAYAVTARREQPELSFWEKDPDVIIHSFDPKVSLDLHQPVVRISLGRENAEEIPTEHPSDRDYAPESVYSREVPMDTFTEAGLHASFMLCRVLPDHAITEQTMVWPALRIPAESRSRNDSQNRYSSVGHRPTRYSEVSKNTFRLRKWVSYSGRRSGPNLISFGSGSGISAALHIGMPFFANGGATTVRMPEDITTYASLPESCYVPTPEKPWQGIWCGDYSGHGCEFILLTQPSKEDERPLPKGMNWLQGWFRSGRRGSESSISSFVSAAEDFEIPSAPPQADSDHSGPHSHESFEARIEDPAAHNHSSSRHTAAARRHVPSGRLEAIKLTGDPNIPRGEYTFIAPDIGENGLVRIADEDTFRDARVVRSAGHIAGRGFTQDEYIPSQLIMISYDRLAQFWEGFGHISYYQRVDLDALMKHEAHGQVTETPQQQQQQHLSAVIGHF